MGYCGVLSGIAGYYWVLGVLGGGVLIGIWVTIEYCSVHGFTAGCMVLQYPLTCGTIQYQPIPPSATQYHPVPISTQ